MNFKNFALVFLWYLLATCIFVLGLSNSFQLPPVFYGMMIFGVLPAILLYLLIKYSVITIKIIALLALSSLVINFLSQLIKGDIPSPLFQTIILGSMLLLYFALQSILPAIYFSVKKIIPSRKSIELLISLLVYTPIVYFLTGISRSVLFNLL